MSISVKFLMEGKGTLWIGKDKITGEQIIKANNENYPSETSIKKLLFTLIDFRSITDFDVETSVIETVARQDERIAFINPDFLTAVVCPQDLPYGMSRMWEIQISDSGLPTLVCRTIDEAIEWIDKKKNLSIKLLLESEGIKL